MKNIQRWISMCVVAAAALVGSFLFNCFIHREALARAGSESQAAPKWQISAIPINNGYNVFMVNQETGEVYWHQGKGDGFLKIAGPVK
jgi:hypothetical protein